MAHPMRCRRPAARGSLYNPASTLCFGRPEQLVKMGPDKSSAGDSSPAELTSSTTRANGSADPYGIVRTNALCATVRIDTSNTHSTWAFLTEKETM